MRPGAALGAYSLKIQTNMKKIALLASIICLTVLTASAQLTNTKWKGMIRIPADSVGTLKPFGVTWTFSKDTATVTYDDNVMEPDVMTYKASEGKLMFKKVRGSVPCNNTDLLTCGYTIKNDQLFLTKVSDECVPRGHADASQPFDRLK
jgi:hypothetical protein